MSSLPPGRRLRNLLPFGRRRSSAPNPRPIPTSTSTSASTSPHLPAGPSPAAATTAAAPTAPAAPLLSVAEQNAVHDTERALRANDWTDLKLLATGEHAAVVADTRVGRRGDTPLHRAAASARPDVVAALLDAGADPNARRGRTRGSRVRRPREDGHTGDGADEEVSGDGGDEVEEESGTPLHDAARVGCVDVVKLLVDAGANPCAVGRGGTTVLMAAAYGGCVRVVKAVVEAGADVEEVAGGKWGNGTSVLHVAAMCGRVDVVSVLVGGEALADGQTRRRMLAYQRTGDGMSALHFACANGHGDVVRVLLDAGAEARVCGTDGCSAYDLAVAHGHVHVETMLRERLGKGHVVSGASEAGEAGVGAKNGAAWRRAASRPSDFVTERVPVSL